APEEKERLQAILATMSGEKRMLEVCAELGIGETRFHQLRETALQAALEAIARKPAGRPSLAALSESEQLRMQQERIEELELALHEAQVREEIALVLPQVVMTRSGEREPADRVGKKMRSQRVKIRKSR
ncbi:MAG TPA: hypothetical protein VKS79_07370, partial [Gemmataceae bacterium]|nr:hypothetical protein [Gemmataceae bacterium]